MFLKQCNSNEARFQVCQLVHEMTKDDINETVEIFKVIESNLISQDIAATDLKGNLFLLKFVVTTLEMENSKKKTVKLLNLMVTLLDQVKLEYFDYVLSYLLRMMKSSVIFFEKFSVEGKAYIKELTGKVGQYTTIQIRNSSKVTGTAQAPAMPVKEIERLANLNKRRRAHQLALVADQNYSAFIDTIYYDSDEEFSITADTKEVDVRESVNTWKKKNVRTNLGVMFELATAGDKDRIWYRDDAVRVAPPGTATLEYNCKLDGI
jgi:hypothetical protein